MKKLYKYTGTVSSTCYRRNNPNALPFLDLVLYDMHDDDKAPIRIEALGGLADYINAIEGTDAEERYLTADWYFDSLLYLHRIEIPSTDPWRPAKIIAQHDAIEPTASIFGPSDYIDEPKPRPHGQRTVPRMVCLQLRGRIPLHSPQGRRITRRRCKPCPASPGRGRSWATAQKHRKDLIPCAKTRSPSRAFWSACAMM